MGIFSWGKYTKVLVDAEKEFVHTYNHALPENEKTFDVAAAIAQRAFYEKAKEKGFTKDDVEAALKGLVKTSHLYQFLIQTGIKEIDAKVHSNIYKYYLTERILESDSLVALSNAVNTHVEETALVQSNSGASSSNVGDKDVNDIITATKIQAADFVGSLKYMDNWSLGYVNGASTTIVRGILELDPADSDNFMALIVTTYSRVYDISDNEAIDCFKKSMGLVEGNEIFQDGMNQAHNDMAKFRHEGETPQSWRNYLGA